MVDIKKQIEYWRQGAREDWNLATDLVEHALLRLVDLTKISLTSEQRFFLSEFDRYQIEGRYPDSLSAQPTPEEGKEQLQKAEEVFQWLMQQF